MLASDSRSNAGVDEVALVKKPVLFEVPGQRVIAVLSAANLATTQAVVTSVRETAGSGNFGHDIHTSRSVFDLALVAGNPAEAQHKFSFGSKTALSG